MARVDRALAQESQEHGPSEQLESSFDYPDSLDYESSLEEDAEPDSSPVLDETSQLGLIAQRSEAIAVLTKARQSLELVDVHSKLQRIINDQYKRDVALLRGRPADTVNVMDFKQNMPLNLAGRQDSTHFFSQAACSVLNLSLHYYCPIEDEVKLKHFDFFSSCLSHDTQYARDSLYHVLYENAWFKDMSSSTTWNTTARDPATLTSLP